MNQKKEYVIVRDSALIALVSPADKVSLVVRRETIAPEAGLKAGWRWLPVIEEYGEPYGDTVEGDAVYRRTQDPSTVPPPRRLVPKRVIVDRLHATGKLVAAKSALDAADLYTQERWNTRTEVYADDETTLQFLASIDADPEVILAE